MEDKHLSEAMARIKKEMHGRFGEKVMKPAILTIAVHGPEGAKEAGEEGEGEPMSNEEDGKALGINGLLDSREPPDGEKGPRKHKR